MCMKKTEKKPLREDGGTVYEKKCRVEAICTPTVLCPRLILHPRLRAPYIFLSLCLGLWPIARASHSGAQTGRATHERPFLSVRGGIVWMRASGMCRVGILVTACDVPVRVATTYDWGLGYAIGIVRNSFISPELELRMEKLGVGKLRGRVRLSTT